MTAVRFVIGITVALVGLAIVTTLPPAAPAAGLWMMAAGVAIVAGAAVATFAALDAMGDTR